MLGCAAGAVFGEGTAAGAEGRRVAEAALGLFRGTSFTGPKGSSCSSVLFVNDGRDAVGWRCSATVQPIIVMIASAAAASSVRFFPDGRSVPVALRLSEGAPGICIRGGAVARAAAGIALGWTACCAAEFGCEAVAFAEGIGLVAAIL